MAATAFAILAGLGLWQLQRMEWKNAHLARIAAAIGAAPVPAGQWLDRQIAANPGGIAEFDYISLRGVFEHEGEAYVFTARNGQPGYLVFTPLRTRNCGSLIAECRPWVNRGFVPENLRDPALRPAGNPPGETEVTGLTRRPETAAWFTPPPDEKRRIYYGASFPQAFYIEANAAPNAGGWPRGRDPQELFKAIPNRHAAYALTWFGLAAALLAVSGFYIRSRRMKRR